MSAQHAIRRRQKLLPTFHQGVLTEAAEHRDYRRSQLTGVLTRRSQATVMVPAKSGLPSTSQGTLLRRTPAKTLR